MEYIALKTRFVPAIGRELQTGKTYAIASDVAKDLAARGIVEAVKPKPKPTKDSLS